MEITKEELLLLLDGFICDNGLVPALNDFLKEKGYSEEEYDEVIEKCKE